MKLKSYSHNDADSVITYGTINSIMNNLSEINFHVKTNSGKNVRVDILNNLKQLGWSNRVQIDSESKLTITSMNNKIGLCLQMGNSARISADLLKLQYSYDNGKISSAIYIISLKNTAKIIGNNVAYYERLIRELKLYNKIITIPIFVIGIEGDKNDN